MSRSSPFLERRGPCRLARSRRPIRRRSRQPRYRVGATSSHKPSTARPSSRSIERPEAAMPSSRQPPGDGVSARRCAPRSSPRRAATPSPWWPRPHATPRRWPCTVTRCGPAAFSTKPSPPTRPHWTPAVAWWLMPVAAWRERWPRAGESTTPSVRHGWDSRPLPTTRSCRPSPAPSSSGWGATAKRPWPTRCTRAGFRQPSTWASGLHVRERSSSGPSRDAAPRR